MQKRNYHQNLNSYKWAWALFILVLMVAEAEAKVYIDIDSPGFRRLPMALFLLDDSSWQSNSCPDSELPEKLTKVLQQDLDISGYFRILSSEAVLVQKEDVELYPKKIDFRAWSLIGADGLILLKVKYKGGKLFCEAQLLDVLSGKLLLWKRYTSELAGYRQVAHRFANEVEKELTGRAGAFDTRLAYISNATGSKELYVMDYDGHGSKKLTSLRSICLSPAWFRDGKQLAFTSFWKKNPGIYMVDMQRTTHLKRLLSGFSPLCSGAAWSSDGKWLAFSASLNGNSEIFRMPFGGKTRPQRMTRNWSIDVSPSWSPNGKQLVFVSDRAGRPDLYIMKIGKNKAKRLTFEGSYNADPDWSPRGDQIVYISRVDGFFQVFRIRPDGTERTQLTTGAGDHLTPVWSPDGRLIAFSSNQKGSYDLYVIRIDGSGRRRLTWDHHDESDPAWSPSLN